MFQWKTNFKEPMNNCDIIGGRGYVDIVQGGGAGGQEVSQLHGL